MKETKLAILKNFTILLVDDDKILNENLAKTLNMFFKEVLTADNGSVALEIFKNKTIDMVISDYVMPIMNGYELCKEIRIIDDKVPIIILSNFQDNEKLLNVIPLNLSSYLIKPIEYTTLIDTLLLMIEKIEKEKIIVEKITPNISYNRLSKRLEKEDENIKLTQNEIILLELFLKHKNILVTNEIIEQEFDNISKLSSSTLVNLIYRLRKKLDKNSIVNVQSFGYIFRKTVES